jgi:hypothetical protein
VSFFLKKQSWFPPKKKFLANVHNLAITKKKRKEGAKCAKDFFFFK